MSPKVIPYQRGEPADERPDSLLGFASLVWFALAGSTAALGFVLWLCGVPPVPFALSALTSFAGTLFGVAGLFVRSERPRHALLGLLLNGGLFAVWVALVMAAAYEDRL